MHSCLGAGGGGGSSELRNPPGYGLAIASINFKSGSNVRKFFYAQNICVDL